MFSTFIFKMFLFTQNLLMFLIQERKGTEFKLKLAETFNISYTRIERVQIVYLFTVYLISS